MRGSYSYVDGSTTYVDSAGLLTQKVTFSPSKTLAFWAGDSPTYAKAIKLEMGWDVEGLDVGAAVPAGITIASGEKSASTGVDQVSNAWQERIANPGDIQFSSHISIYDAGFETHGSFLFGTTWHPVNGD